MNITTSVQTVVSKYHFSYKGTRGFLKYLILVWVGSEGDMQSEFGIFCQPGSKRSHPQLRITLKNSVSNLKHLLLTKKINQIWLNLWVIMWWCVCAQACPTLCHLIDCSPPSFSVDGMGCHFFLQGIFLTQGSNLYILCQLL